MYDSASTSRHATGDISRTAVGERDMHRRSSAVEPLEAGQAGPSWPLAPCHPPGTPASPSTDTTRTHMSPASSSAPPAPSPSGSSASARPRPPPSARAHAHAHGNTPTPMPTPTPTHTLHTTPAGSPSYTSYPTLHTPARAGPSDIKPRTAAARPKFSRSKDGCLTCRKRRKRCDLTAPRCRACDRLHLACTWPGNVLPSRSLSPSVRGVRGGSWLSARDHGHDRSESASLAPPLGDDALAVLGWTAENMGADSGLGEAAAGPNPNSLSSSTAGAATGLSSVSPHVGLLPDLPLPLPLPDMLGLFDLDEATLQLWAADCMLPLMASGAMGTVADGALLSPTGVDGGPSGAIGASGASGPSGGGSEIAPAAASLPTPPTSGDRPPLLRPGSRDASVSAPSDLALAPGTTSTVAHSDLLRHFQHTLSRLVSCSGDTRGFEAFTALADSSAALYLSILAWAGRHLANSGRVRYEAVSERLGAQAGAMVLAQLEQVAQEIELEGERSPGPGVGRGGGAGGSREEVTPGDEGRERTPRDMDRERMTLLAAALMVMQFRICRGDVWGFDVLSSHTSSLASALFDHVDTAQDPMAAQFFDNLVYHDILCSLSYTRGPMVAYALVEQQAAKQRDLLHTLTGVNMPVFAKMYRLVALVRQRRRAGARSEAMSDETLVDLVRSAERLEEELDVERLRIDTLVKSKPEIQSHRYLHEVFRTASLIQIRGFILCEPPCSLKMRLLVRQSLSLLEAMVEHGLPGLCSIHWVLFITAVCAVPQAPGADRGAEAAGGTHDRARVEKLYADFQREIHGFPNVARSRRIVREVWARNQDGRVFYDWLDVVADWDWEICLV